YAAFYDEYVKLNAFLHSHSFTGNPLGCAAARASLAIFRDDHVLEANRTLAARLGERAGALADHPHVAEVRQRGMILAIELAADKASRAPYPWQERRGLRVYRHALTRGVLLRPIGNVVYFMPPYVITPAEIDLMVEVAREGPRSLTLGQGVSRGERMDFVVQKATELGASSIVPLLTERSVVRLSAPQAARKLEHWRAIAVSACEQSGRNRLPKVLSPLPLADFLRQSGSGPRLLLSPTGSTRIQDVPTPVSSVTVLIGPEGGLADAEQSAALAAGFTAVRLGPRILRTETAAIAALTVLQREFGDL